FCLVKVARADVEDVAVERRAQRLGAGEWPDKGNTRSGEDRLGGVRRRRADITEQQEDAVVDQLFGVGRGPVALVAVVERTQLDLAPVDASGSIDDPEVCRRTGAHLRAKLGGRAGKR